MLCYIQLNYIFFPSFLSFRFILGLWNSRCDVSSFLEYPDGKGMYLKELDSKSYSITFTYEAKNFLQFITKHSGNKLKNKITCSILYIVNFVLKNNNIANLKLFGISNLHLKADQLTLLIVSCNV